MTKPVADSRTLVYPFLAFVRIPVLISVVESERTPSLICDKADGEGTIDLQLGSLGSPDLDLVVGIGRAPCTNTLPVPVIAHRLGWICIVQQINFVLVRAVIAAQPVRGCERGEHLVKQTYASTVLLTINVDVGFTFVCIHMAGER
jgi:hypothetical protein